MNLAGFLMKLCQCRATQYILRSFVTDFCLKIKVQSQAAVLLSIHCFVLNANQLGKASVDSHMECMSLVSLVFLSCCQSDSSCLFSDCMN